MLQVPNYLTFTVSTSKLDANPRVERLFQNPKVYVDAPWWAKLSVDLNVCDQIDSRKSSSASGGSSRGEHEEDDIDTVDMRPWLNSLPRSFDTPIRWTKEQREALQYPPILSMIAAQEKKTRDTFNSLKGAIDPSSSLMNLSYEDFLWGCDCARSRAFSGAYGGTAFDPKPYALTLLLVAVYLGLGLGTVEQASNGAALVFCGTILKDFVLPKLFKSKKYVICPLIDMANHKGMKEDANVAFEYFADSYSLSTKSDVTMDKNCEIFISYGPRSNDALLQQYGFVECDNAHDVYIMPPLREWNIAALEESCGRTFQPGRLEKLERAGLLGGEPLGKEGDEDSLEEGIANRGRGVVITRAGGIDPAILTALRVLVSTNEEWDAVGQAVGNMVTEFSGGKENERIARNVAKKAMELELMSKPTTLEEDEQSWKIRDSLGLSAQDVLALQFRIEKKKLLREAIFALSLV
jgi:Rubisco LSMT substrate-binding.